MRKKNLLISLFSLMMVIVLSACTSNDGEASVEDTSNEKNSNEEMNMNEDNEGSMEENMNGSSSEGEMNNGSMGNGHMDHDDVVSLIDSTGENELNIPRVLKSDSNKGTEYTIRAQKGETEIFDGVQTKTYGYNGSFLGPMLQFEKGDTTFMSKSSIITAS